MKIPHVTGREATAALKWFGIPMVAVIDIADDTQLIIRDDPNSSVAMRPDETDIQWMLEEMVKTIVHFHQHYLTMKDLTVKPSRRRQMEDVSGESYV